mmetsp:Transcript_81635/g.218363  ORF Transcript_81635/g.218363 Transcript_81635/m.218363 type:complete len:203 (+) Transcript_81635:2028-2636(+)
MAKSRGMGHLFSSVHSSHSPPASTCLSGFTANGRYSIPADASTQYSFSRVTVGGSPRITVAPAAQAPSFHTQLAPVRAAMPLALLQSCTVFSAVHGRQVWASRSRKHPSVVRQWFTVVGQAPASRWRALYSARVRHAPDASSRMVELAQGAAATVPSAARTAPRSCSSATSSLSASSQTSAPASTTTNRAGATRITPQIVRL